MKNMDTILNNIIKTQDSDGHWYWIPKELIEKFNDILFVIDGKDYMDCSDVFDNFNNIFEKYRTMGDSNLIPDFYKKEIQKNDFKELHELLLSAYDEDYEECLDKALSKLEKIRKEI